MDAVKSEVAQLARELRARIETMKETGVVVRAVASKRFLASTAASPVPGAIPAEKVVQPLRQYLPPYGRQVNAPGISQLKILAETVSACRKCPLGSSRLQAVFGVGAPDADVMFIGEGPGFQEDHQGEPFVGRAGKLLDKILESIGLSRRTVYIANIVKCHPMVNPSNPEARGNDRPPSPEEIAACRPYLEEQIRMIAPRVIVTLGSVATKTLLGEDVPISKVRGLWREYRGLGDVVGIKLLPTYHPAALLRNPNLKRDVWTDMKNLRKELESKT